MPQVHNKYHKTAGPDAIYIGRPSVWGNPFSHMEKTVAVYKTETREEAVVKYEEWLLSQKDLVSRVKSELKGKDLVCWCAPRACHGDVLLKIANQD